MKARLDSLVSAYIEGSIPPADLRQLNDLLREDAEARREFTELMNLDSALAALSAEWALEQEQEQDEAKPTRSGPPAFPRLMPVVRWIAAALCALAVLLAWGWHTTHAPFATVEGAAGVAGLANGTRLRAEPHEIAAGTLSLITARGARIVIEAPADFRFESAQRLHIRRGRLSADVPPPAKGFTVITPSGDAVDLGTRFGVDVPAEGAAEVHVFQGTVITRASGANENQSLQGGDAVMLDQGTSASRELRSAAFIQPDEMRELSAGLAAGQRARAEDALESLRRDPALVALLDFESNEPLPGVYRTVQGRWPGSHAPEFVSVGDHLKLDAGGAHAWAQLTLAAWVRIDRLGEPYQSLLHTDGWSLNNAGQVHWMINRDTTMRLALIGNELAPGSDEHYGYPDSRTPVLPEQGRWVHLATIYDSVKGTVRFYLNGRFDKETRQSVALPARLGPAQIGNWNQKDRKLSGRVDEMILLGRAMSDDEVRALYTAGNPYR